MIAPSGIGGWIAFRQRIGTAAAAAALAIELGCAWVAPRAGAGGINDPAFLPPPAKRGDREALKAAICAEIKAYHDAGLLVFPWLYSRPGSWRAEVEAFALLVECGADGIIIDAEIEWGNHESDAVAYGRALRLALGDTWIADAPWPWIRSHPEYPERAFAAFVDARLPQDYWCEINRAGARADVARQQAEWSSVFADPKRTADELDPIWPVACTYGRAELIHAGAPPCPGEMVPDDLDWFLDAHEGQPVSLYSLEMLLVDTPNGHECRTRLRERAERARPSPVGPVEVERASDVVAPIGADVIEGYKGGST